MKACLHSSFSNNSKGFNEIIKNFETSGEDFGNQKRNSLKLFSVDNFTVNVKSFRVPNIVNRIAYRFLRKSKAQRSYEYACKLKNLQIGTPQPIGYYEYNTLFLFGKSYYISEQVNCDLTFRELTIDLNYPNHEEILRAFTRFTFNLHEKGVHFLDHSPGNTLITKKENSYDFALVDLNRMEFKELNFETRMQNFARLTKEKHLVETMANEYAKLYHKEESIVFQKMWDAITEFQNSFARKRRLKKKLKFWKTTK